MASAPNRKFGPGGPESDRSSDATTNLSVAAYTDPEFRDKVLNDICSRRDRALAPSPGVDISLIARHARRVRSSDAFAMLCLVAYLTWRVWEATPEQRMNLFLALGVWLFVAWAIHRMTVGLQTTVHYGVGKLLTFVDMLIWASLLGFTWAVLEARRAFFGLDWSFDLPVTELLLAGAIGSAMPVYRAIRVLRIPVKRNPWTLWSPRAEGLDRLQRPEIVIHPDRAKRRFTGFGKEKFGREVHLPLLDEQGLPQPAPDLEELITVVRKRIGSLVDETADASVKAHLEVFEEVHLPDSKVTRRRNWLKHWKVGGRRFASIAEVRADPDWAQYVYLRIQVSQEGGEVVTNVFFRCEVRADTLYLEFSPHHLYLTDRRYHLFRGGRAKRVLIVVSAAVLGFATAPLLVPQTPVSLRRTFWQWLKRVGRWFRRNLKSDFGDCGPPIGLREMGSDPEPPPRQKAETERIALIVTRHCLESLWEHLRGTIDVTDLVQHIGKVAKEFNVVNVSNAEGGTMYIAAVGEGAEGNVGSMGEGSRGSIQKAPEAGRA